MGKEFNTDLARHQTHAIGAPSPEADGSVMWPGEQPGGEIARPRVVAARANWGRWIVDCWTTWCTNAWMPELGEAEWVCTICGVPNVIEWPPDPIAIEAILLMRPDPNTRNWEPGEGLNDLIMQNAEHGILPPKVNLDDPDPAGYDVMEERDGHVIGGLIYGPVEEWRAIRTNNPSITADGEPRAYREIGA